MNRAARWEWGGRGRFGRVLACVWCVIPQGMFAMILVSYACDIWPRDVAPAFESVGVLCARLILGCGVMLGGLAVAIANLVHHVTWTPAKSGVWWRGIVSLVAIPVVFAPFAARLCIPLEDPYTGLGSPLAVALAMAWAMLVLGVVFLPVAVWLALMTREQNRGLRL